MANVLTDEQVRTFHDTGVVTPLRAISEEEAGACRGKLEAYEAETGKPAVDTIHIKGHLYFDWAWQLARHPRIVGAIADLAGPDLFILASRFWVKNPHDQKYVNWHQDHAYFGLTPPTVLTAWVALTEMSRDVGCMRYIPGSHKDGARVHFETEDGNNMLSRGQGVQDVDASTTIYCARKPGEFSISHGHVLHSSEPNLSDKRCIVFALMYIPVYVDSAIGRRAATLVNGEDRYGYWDHDPMPARDRDPVIMDLMNRANRHYRDRSHKQDTKIARG